MPPSIQSQEASKVGGHGPDYGKILAQTTALDKERERLAAAKQKAATDQAASSQNAANKAASDHLSGLRSRVSSLAQQEDLLFGDLVEAESQKDDVAAERISSEIEASRSERRSILDRLTGGRGSAASSSPSVSPTAPTPEASPASTPDLSKDMVATTSAPEFPRSLVRDGVKQGFGAISSPGAPLAEIPLQGGASPDANNGLSFSAEMKRIIDSNNANIISSIPPEALTDPTVKLEANRESARRFVAGNLSSMMTSEQPSNPVSPAPAVPVAAPRIGPRHEDFVRAFGPDVKEGSSVKIQGAPGDFYTVKQGDTLFDISKALRGDGNFFNAVAEWNGIDPHRIIPGQVLYIPSTAGEPKFSLQDLFRPVKGDRWVEPPAVSPSSAPVVAPAPESASASPSAPDQTPTENGTATSPGSGFSFPASLGLNEPPKVAPEEPSTPLNYHRQRARKQLVARTQIAAEKAGSATSVIRAVANRYINTGFNGSPMAVANQLSKLVKTMRVRSAQLELLPPDVLEAAKPELRAIEAEINDTLKFESDNMSQRMSDWTDALIGSFANKKSDASISGLVSARFSEMRSVARSMRELGFPVENTLEISRVAKAQADRLSEISAENNAKMIAAAGRAGYQNLTHIYNINSKKRIVESKLSSATAAVEILNDVRARFAIKPGQPGAIEGVPGSRWYSTVVTGRNGLPMPITYSEDLIVSQLESALTQKLIAETEAKEYTRLLSENGFSDDVMEIDWSKVERIPESAVVAPASGSEVSPPGRDHRSVFARGVDATSETLQEGTAAWSEIGNGILDWATGGFRSR